jgi:hypothetical protein
MSETGLPDQFFIGWDVGGWNCDKNRASRDAIVILDAKRNIVGLPWRGNLRVTINEADSSRSWLQALFAHCQADFAVFDNMEVVLAIDTPLGFSEEFTRLLARLGFSKHIGLSDTNPYLFRKTEQFLFDHGLKPLSPLKDMIGSQATKGIHVLAKFTPMMPHCGVWTDGATLTAIEAYPSACNQSPLFQKLLGRYVIGERVDSSGLLWVESIDHQDKLDALTCALVAHTFKFQSDLLAHPPEFIPRTEGWIWVPNDALQPDVRRVILID